MRRQATWTSILLAILAGGSLLNAQYFGQNKVRHRVLHFEVMRTPHFDIYYYPEEHAATEEVARMAERWNTRLSRLLNHVLTTRQPLILYASHTDFEQTTAVPGMIEASVGGVTMSIGRKVVLPLAGPLADTDHVLGHELVHAFQYDMTTIKGQGGSPGAGNMPLWFIEGMAEYLSVGPDDPNTAMWLRDAVARKAMPTVRDLENPNKYFPYRFGEAFWAYVGGRYGDDKIGPMLLAANKTGSIEGALQTVLHVSGKQLSEDWKSAAEAAVQPVLAATQPIPAANLVVAAAPKQSAKMNVSPAVSPDGKYVMFYSERGLFSINLYLADARTGRIIRRVTSTAVSAHFNNLLFINSAGAWSSDGSQFAFGHVEGGKASISVYNLAQNAVTRTYRIANTGEIFSPTWSPVSNHIAFTAIAGGLTNLYELDVASGAVRQLTDDMFAELQPAWSPDGRTLAFATDRFTSNLGDLSFGQYRLGLYDLASGNMRAVPGDFAGDATNPQWSPDGRTLYFLSTANGVPNLYSVNLDTQARQALTNLQTGVSGITALSPAFSVAARTGEIVYSAFTAGGYDLARLTPPFAGTEAAAVTPLHAAILPPRTSDAGAVAGLLQNPQLGLPAAPANYATGPYKSSLSLDYVAPPRLAVGVSNYGTQLGGGTALHFGDMLGYQNLTVAFEALTSNGVGNFVRDLSAQALYTNDRHRWTWGIGGGQTPFASSGFGVVQGTINGRPVAQTEETTVWQENRQISGLLAYPFSRAERLEFTGGYENIGFAAEANTQLVDLITGQVLAEQKQDVPAPRALNFATASGALVYDTSIFGGVSPILGQSYRLQAGWKGGSLNYGTLLADYRRYVGISRPLSLAGRFITYGRYGAAADDPRLEPLFLGYPEMVRGYDLSSFNPSECGAELATTGACPAFDRLVGSKTAVVNAEARLEILGPLGVVSSAAFPPLELAPFFDAGTAWTAADKPTFLGGHRHPVSSEGLTLRVNILGYAIGSVSYALPNNRPGRSHVWEFALLPGY